MAKQMCENLSDFVQDTIIHICLAFDNGYLPHAAVTILSAAQTLKPGESLVVHILHSDCISAADKHRFAGLAASVTLQWYRVDIGQYRHLPDNRDHVSIATYLRLFIPDILNGVAARVIYLDCDTIVTRSLGDLWATDLKQQPIAAAPDEGGRTQSDRLTLPAGDFYFNAGVLLFDLNAIDPGKLLNEATKLAQDRSISLELQDQDILNLVFAGLTTRLHLRWNASTRVFTPNPFDPAYTKDEAKEASKAPAIVHFTDYRKPWNSNCNHPLRGTYWELRNQTPWRETAWQKALRQTKNVLRNIFSKSRKSTRSAD